MKKEVRDKINVIYKKNRDLVGTMISGIIGAIITYSLVSFLPYVFGQKFAEIEFMIPKIKMHFYDVSYYWSAIGFPVRVRDGEILIGGGLGYTLSYYIATLVASIFAFIFLRKFHKSKVDPVFQLVISLTFSLSSTIISNMINGLWLPILYAKLNFLQYNLITLSVIGIIQFIVGHIANLIIYKNHEKKEFKKDELN